MAQGPLTPVTLIATAGMLPVNSTNPQIGSSLAVSSNLTAVIDDYENLPVVAQYINVMTLAQPANLANSTLSNLQTLGSGTFPALTDVIPSGYDLTEIAPGNVYIAYSSGNQFVGGFSGLITSMATNIMGGGDLTRFLQIYGACQGYAGLTNQYINSTLNVATIASTFGPTNGGMDNVTTGGWNQVTQAYGAFGQDLTNLGRLINMKDLDVLGSPAALLKQLAAEGGLYPAVVNVLTQAGVTTDQISDVAAGRLGEIDDSVNKLIYQAMTQIVGNTLQQVCAVLGVTLPIGQSSALPFDSEQPFAQPLSPAATSTATANTINTMADLLNPVKIFPNSFATLTMPTPDGLRAIYATVDGAVNTNLEQYLTSTPATLPNFTRPVTVEVRTVAIPPSPAPPGFIGVISNTNTRARVPTVGNGVGQDFEPGFEPSPDRPLP